MNLDIADADYDVGADFEYDEGADPDYDEVVVDVVPVIKPEPVVFAPPAVRFAFEVGRPVLPLTQEQTHPIMWRGYLKELHPSLVYFSACPCTN